MRAAWILVVAVGVAGIEAWLRWSDRRRTEWANVTGEDET